MEGKEKEIELVDLFKVLWKHKYLIFLGTFVCTVISIIYSLSLPRIYRATATFVVTTSPVKGESGNLSQSYYEISANTFKAIAKSKANLGDAIDEFNLKQGSEKITLEDFQENVSVKAVPTSKLLLLEVYDRDPKLAAEIANYLAGKAVELNAKLNQEDTVKARQFLQNEVDQAWTELGEAEKKYLVFQKSPRLETNKSQLQLLRSRYSSYLEHLKNIEVSLAVNKAVLDYLKEAMKHRSPKINLSRSIIDDPAYQQIISSVSPNQRDILKLKMEGEILDTNYMELEMKKINLETERKELTTRKSTILNSLEDLDENIRILQADIAEKTIAQGHVDRRLSLANSIYNDRRLKLEQASLNITSSATELKIVDPAVPPSSPVKPRKRVIVTVSFVVSGMIFVFFAFFYEYFYVMWKEGRLAIEKPA